MLRKSDNLNIIKSSALYEPFSKFWCIITQGILPLIQSSLACLNQSWTTFHPFFLSWVYHNCQSKYLTPIKLFLRKILRFPKRIWNQRNLIPHNRNHIKPAVDIFRISVGQHVVPCHGKNLLLLLMVHRFQRQAASRRTPVFHLHKHQIISVQGNQINLSETVSVIPFQNPVSLLL